MLIGSLRHLRYLFWHKLYVLVFGRRRGISIGQLLLHDWSKFLPSEFVPYTRHFFVWPNEPETYDDYRRAFALHCARNPHHWEHWIVNDVARQMPVEYVLEMLSDWDAAGLCKTGSINTHAWYANNRGGMTLHPDTRQFIQQELKVVF